MAVIGAGVTGGMIARKLSGYDLKICILERKNDVAMGATRANSAIVHAGFDAKEGSNKAKFNVKGSEMMEKVANELGVPWMDAAQYAKPSHLDGCHMDEENHRRLGMALAEKIKSII